ncbi:MAG TPA: EF-P lysine aminoacylase EpmA [Candidatus Acidoferrum sp.]|nr:EF-P lysine aminoacylase EpmA [Candidatus Acidoferrum sp.]
MTWFTPIPMSNRIDWQPTAVLAALQARAALNSRIRAFFAARGVLEVETPLLGQHSGTDPNLQPITAAYQPHASALAQLRYLQTSPEFAMKRLLAAGSGAIYQLGKAFRNGERGERHNPEFTMLEWYRPGFSLTQLMDEVEALVSDALSLPGRMHRMSYRDLFVQTLGIDPHTVSLDELQQMTAAMVAVDDGALHSRAACLDLLYGHVLEPMLQDPVLIYHYPAEQAALSRVVEDEQGQPVALRFELVMRGMELANGYDELLDADEQRYRFAVDRELRKQHNLDDIQPDERLLAALQQGLPACSGVALGVDRLLMLILSATSINEVLAFPHERA